MHLNPHASTMKPEAVGPTKFPRWKLAVHRPEMSREVPMSGANPLAMASLWALEKVETWKRV